MYYKVCSDCGSHLDPGELCNCQVSYRPSRSEALTKAPVNYYEQRPKQTFLAAISAAINQQNSQVETIFANPVSDQKYKAEGGKIMLEDLKAKILEIESCITRAISAEDTARQAYLESRSECPHDTQEVINECQERLEIAWAENELLLQRLVVALINGDKDAKAATEEKIIATSTYIRNLENSLETLNRASPKGNPDLYADLIKSNNAKAAALIGARKAVNSIKVLTASLIGDLSVIQTSMHLKFKSKLMESIDQPDTQLIEIVESYEGPIDVTGHTAGMDGIAKMRYIHGNIDGIEGTPAGQKLIAKGRN